MTLLSVIKEATRAAYMGDDHSFFVAKDKARQLLVPENDTAKTDVAQIFHDLQELMHFVMDQRSSM